MRTHAPPFDVTAAIVVRIIVIVGIRRSPIAKTVDRKTAMMMVMTMASMAVNEVATWADRSRTSMRSDSNGAATCWHAT